MMANGLTKEQYAQNILTNPKGCDNYPKKTPNKYIPCKKVLIDPQKTEEQIDAIKKRCDKYEERTSKDCTSSDYYPSF